MKASDDPTLVSLAATRARTWQAVVGGRPGGILDPRAALDDYRAALTDCPLDREQLTAAWSELTARLDQGLTLPGDDPVVGDHFASLLSRYEAVSDALDRDGTRRRLARWELMVVDRT